MARPLRLEFEGAWYHVMNRGAGQRDIFHDHDQRAYFLELVGILLERYAVETHAYCLMGNHYHLLLHTPHANLARAMRHLDGVYTQHFNRVNDTDGPLFRGRYRAMIVDADAYLLQVSRYIHRNPLEAGMTEALSRYPWSSYPAYIGDREGPAWLQRQAVQAIIGADPRRYREFVEQAGAEPDDSAVMSADAGSPTILGDDAFRESVLAHFNGDPREVPATRRPSSAPPTGEQIVVATARTLGVSSAEPYRSQRGVRNDSRLLAIFLCQKLGQMRLEAIREQFALQHYGSAAAALDRYRRIRGWRADLREAEARVQADLQQEL